MTFTVYIEGQALSDGVSVFPFSFGQLLDERLDEAYLHITKSSTPTYKPTTEVRIDLREGNATVKQFYFVVAKDNAYELPVGSGKYRHDIHLIERTKLLEGIYCQSITFTNSIGNNYTANAKSAACVGIEGTFSYIANQVYNNSFLSPPSSFSVNGYKTPHDRASAFIIQSIDDVWTKLKEDYLSATFPGFNYYLSTKFDDVETKIVITTESDTTTITDVVETVSLSDFNSAKIEYYFCYTRSSPTGSYSYGVYAFSFDIIAVTNTLPLKPLTVTDCINRVLDIAEPRFGGSSLYDAPNTAFFGDQPRFRLNAAQAAEFAKIPAPEFTMTQCTLREQLKVIGGYIHGEPRLSYNNEIYFDMYGNPEDSTEINASTPYVYRCMTHDIAQYCTQIDTSASNIVNALNYAQGVVFSPNKANIKTIRTESVNIRVTEENGFVETDFPIQDIVKVECSYYTESGSLGMGLKDITPYVFTETAYNSSLSTYGGGYPRSKSYGIYYAIGQNGIRGLFFKEQSADFTLAPYLEYYSIVNIFAKASGFTPKAIRDALNGDYTRLVFRVSYVPIYNARFSHGKQYIESGTEYTQIYNQSENIIETRYFGENVKGVAARLGNVEQTRTYIFNTFSQIPKVGELINVGTSAIPDEYAISAVNTEVLPNYYKTTVALTKDFNRISEYVGISSNKRVYEVSEREAYLRNILLKEYAIVGRLPRNGYSYTPGIFRSTAGILSAFSPGTSDLTITTAIAWGGTVKYPSSKQDMPPLPMVALPVVSSAFGNSLVFSWGYKDNYSAGARLTEQTNGQVIGKWMQDVAYGDNYGKMYYYNFFLLSASNTPNRGYAFALSSPAVASQPVDSSNSSHFRRSNSDIKTDLYKPYRIRKDSREILNFNFEVEFKSNVKNLIIGSGLAASSKLVGASGGAAVFHGITGGKIGRFDSIYPVAGGVSLPYVARTDTRVVITLPSGAQNYDAWVIHTPYVAGTPYQVEDERGEVSTYTPHTGGGILLACNNPAALYQELGGNTIYINLSKLQKEETQ